MGGDRGVEGAGAPDLPLENLVRASLEKHPPPIVGVVWIRTRMSDGGILFFLCSQRNFGRHIVIALSDRPSVRPCVRPSRFHVRSISRIFLEVGISN